MQPTFFVFDGSIPKVLSFVKENFYSSHPTCFPHGFAPPPGQNLDAVPLAAWNAQPAQASSPADPAGASGRLQSSLRRFIGQVPVLL